MNQQNDDLSSKNYPVEPVDPIDTGQKPISTKPQNTEEMDRLNRVLLEVDPGWKIAIMRVAPSWCRGHLETYEVYDPSESVDINYLIKYWGGHKLHLKVHNEKGHIVGGGSVALYSYPPRVHGVELREEDYFTQNPIVTRPAPVIQQQPAVPASSGIDIMQLMNILQKGSKNELELAMKILDRAPTAPAQQFGNMAEQMTAMFGLIAQFREMFANEGMPGGHGGGSDDSILPMVGDLVKGLMSANQQKQLAPHAKQNIYPPQQQRMRPPPRQNPPPSPVHSIENRQTFPKTIENGVDYLLSLDPSDVSKTLIDAMKKMPGDKRLETVTRFLHDYSQDPQLDDMENMDDTFSQDDYDDEPNEYDDGAYDNSSSVPGFESDPDARNHPPDRPGNPERFDLPSHPQPRGVPRNPGKA